MRSPLLAACAAAAAVASVLSATAAIGQSLDDRLRAELTSVLAQLHDLQNNQASLEAAKAAAEHDRDALKAKLAKAGGGGARPTSPAVQAELTAEQAKNAQLTEALQAAQADAQKYRDALSQAAQSAQQAGAERDRLAVQAKAGVDAIADCETKNIQLIGIAREILGAYARVGVPQAMARGEPLLGLERAKLERVAQDYGDRVYSDKFDPRVVKPASSGAGH